MLTIKGIYGREMYETWYAMSSMLTSSERLRASVSAVITDRFAASDWAKAFDTARSGSTGKVVLDWS
jgi:threonine 3-dehydrogenase